ncbi:MAG: D-alanyl-D-alanine carboxypeptidase [Patescibacteria group bacterium]|nr:D-alanyl-D-alanine carboxypeptidase [Patescibacteria group bacterium]MDE2588721.1 D-alanyl-D-alanine carboxypeptidase [Patescibacteria group bacterium]
MSGFLKIYIFFVILCVLLAGILSWILFPQLHPDSTVIQIPLPTFLARTFNNQVTTLDIWEPVQSFIAQALGSSLPVSAKSALSYDLTTNTPLFELDPKVKLPMASLTKIMTAVIALEHPKPDDQYIVRGDALVGEDSMGLSEGEILDLQDLLYGLILHSGNDAAEVLAENFPGGRGQFIDAMNKKAVALGLTNTHFTNPTGLEGDGSQYTTAYDLLTLTRYALETFPAFDDVAAAATYTISQTQTHKEYDLENETNLLTTYPGVKGVKTGYTPEAGLCLVTYLDYKGHKIIAIVLGSEDRRDDMKEILDYSLQKLHVTPPHHG